MLEHGGNLLWAAAHYGIAPERWLDLSTGVNPRGYPVPEIPPSTWLRLPEAKDGLERVAGAYYGTDCLRPVAGSQAAIQTLPRLFPPRTRIGILSPTYGEHPYSWQQQGHQVIPLAANQVEEALPTIDLLLVVHPNNPTGQRLPVATLTDWHDRLTAQGGWLILDEAFMDTTPEDSLAHRAGQPGLILLRSLGKFFGLAGARVGFVLGPSGVLDRLATLLGPWAVSGPSRFVARQALADQSWQIDTRQRLHADSDRLRTVLTQAGLPPTGSTPLFQWVTTPHHETIQNALAGRGIWIRRFTDPPSLRFGLPADEEGWARLHDAVKKAVP